jgi:hypothetical protein
MVSLGEGYVLPPNDTGATCFCSLGWQGTPLAGSHSHFAISTDTSFWTTPTEPHAGSRILYSASKTAISTRSTLVSIGVASTATIAKSIRSSERGCGSTAWIQRSMR